jgi:uncharacterized protein
LKPYSLPLVPESGASVAALAGTFETGIVDAHVHIFPPEMIRERESFLSKDAWFGTLYRSTRARMVSAEDVVSQMDRDGIETSVVFGFAFKDQDLCRHANDYVVDSVRRHPERLVGLACVSPEAPDAVAELERCLNSGLRGCGELMPDGQGFAIGEGGATESGVAGSGRQSGFAAVVGCLEERGLPLLIHANEPVGHDYAGKGRFTPRACFDLARAYPSLTIVFAHMGGGLFLYELMPEVRQVLTRVYYDTSAVPYLYDPKVYEAAIACAGEQKLIFGSDYPLLPPGRYLAGLGSLSSGARASALGETARKVFQF